MCYACDGAISSGGFGARDRALASKAPRAISEVPANVKAVAAKYGIIADDLDWHVEAEHGREPHDIGYPDAVEAAARCQLIYGRSCRHESAARTAEAP